MKIIVMYLVFGCLSYIMFKQPNTTTADILIWNKSKLLTWENFKGTPDTFSKYAAVTNCNIETNFRAKKDTLFIRAVSYMQSSLSWVKIKSKNANLLKHEQVHFDISELYIRKLRQTILSTKFAKTQIGNELNKLISGDSQSQYVLQYPCSRKTL